jgi:hypothetical protein
MAKDGLYQQGTLRKEQGDSTLSRTIWGPADKMVPGNHVKVEEDNGSWTDGWLVAAVHGEPLPEKLVRHMGHAHTRQRKASDI